MATKSVVHLIDDDDAVRRSLAFLLAASGYAVRVHELATAFLAIAPGLRGGCIVSDVRMPGMDGLALQRRLRELGVRTPMIIMTGHADVALAVEAMKAGAIDFLEKPFDDELLLSAIRIALEGQAGEDEPSDEAAAVRARLARLTPRETEVLEGLLAGRPNKTIAYDLGISPRTVEVHRASLMTRMGARSLAELVRMTLAARG